MLAPPPDVDTVSVKVWMNVATTVRSALMVTVQVEAVVQPAATAPEPDQPVNRDPTAAVAVSVTCVAGDVRS